MKSPICVTNIFVSNRKQTASFSIAGLMLAIAPLWLMLAFGNTSCECADVNNRYISRTGRSFTATTCSAGIRMRRCSG